MLNFLKIFSLIFCFSSYAEEQKLAIDIQIDNLDYKKPAKGVGKAGNLIFKSANVLNNGIVLNVNNVNSFFDSQIFVRPTFLGFTTQFGNYGVTIDEKSVLNTVDQTQLKNTKFILDENQLNLAGEFFSFAQPDMNLKLSTFRLYCQNLIGPANPNSDVLISCFNFLTLNGSYLLNNAPADVEFTSFSSNEKTFMKGKIQSFDLRSNQLNLIAPQISLISNDSYIIKANNLDFNCDKDPDLNDFNADKIKKACFNRLNIKPVKAELIDNEEKSNFKLDVKNVTVKDRILYLSLNSGVLSDNESSTYINNMLLNCRKDEESDLLELNHVLRDCITFGKISVAEVKSDNKDPEKKDSTNKNIAVNMNNGALVVQTDVKFIGLTKRVSIYGNVSLNETRNQIMIKVTEAKLPFGITSVKLLFYFLKKDLISKDITINGNTITISL